MLNEELKKIINDKLFVYELLPFKEANNFFMIIDKYLNNRTRIETFIKNLDDTICFYEKLDIVGVDIINSIAKWPAIIHANKNDLLIKYLLLGKVVDSKNHQPNRRRILINSPKDFMTGIDTIYARMMYLLSESGTNILRNEYITRRKLLKITHKEFEDIYCISIDDLLRKFSFDQDKLKDIMNWPENIELVEKLADNKGVKM